MRVLFTLDSLNRGGAETLALDVCRNASANGLDLVFAATGGGQLEREFASSGTPFFRLHRRLPVDPLTVAGLRRIITAEKIDIVHAHQAVEGLHAWLATRGTKTRVVLTHHGFVPNRKNRLTLEFLIPRVTRNLVVSAELKNWLADACRLPTDDFEVLYNGVDERRITSDGCVRDEFGGGLLFGMIGNFYAAPRKDQLTVCRALPEVLEKVPDARFVFVGGSEPGSDFEACVALINEARLGDRVFFAGVRSDIAQILYSLDVFVLSSRHEGLPIALAEALLAGVPAVLSDIPPLLEMSQNGEFARIFPTGDASALASRMIELAQNKDARTELARCAQRFARAEFSIEAHLARLKLLYNSL